MGRETCEGYRLRILGDTMNYMISFVMEGQFPGSPDVDTFVVTEEEYDKMWDYLKSIRKGCEN